MIPKPHVPPFVLIVLIVNGIATKIERRISAAPAHLLIDFICSLIADMTFGLYHK
jgi:hypothetical protein